MPQKLTFFIVFLIHFLISFKKIYLQLKEQIAMKDGATFNRIFIILRLIYKKYTNEKYYTIFILNN